MNGDTPTMPTALSVLVDRARRLGLLFQPLARAEGGEGIRLEPRGAGLVSIVARHGGRGVHAPIADPRCPKPPCGALLVADAAAEAERLAEALRWTLADQERHLEDQSVVGDFCEKLAQAYEETYTLFRALRLLASADEPRVVVEGLAADIQQTLPFRWIAVHFADHERVVAPLRGQLIVAGDPPADRAALRQLTLRRLQATGFDSWTKVLATDRDPLAAFAGSEVVCEPVTHDGIVIGTIFAGGKSGADSDVASPEMQFLDATADFLGTFHENMARYDEQRAMARATLESLVAAIDAKDRYTCGHSERVAMLARSIAEAMGLETAIAERVQLSGLVHDVGKIGVPEAILCKPGKPTDDEFAAIRRHPEIGHRILRGIVGFDDLLPGVLHHHERWDGKGYPHGLAGESIPLQARIIGLADAFDAMSSTRSYRPALPRERVLEEVRRGAGTQFDPRLVLAFQRVDLAAYDAMLTDHAALGDWREPPREAA